MIDWYIPWAHLDWVLRLQIIIWIAIVGFSFWVSWRTLVRKRPWLTNNKEAD